MISIVITTYQRRHIVQRAIDSALRFTQGLDGAEVIVVDDASTDGSPEMLAQRYAQELDSGAMRLIVHAENQGVTGAKNTGGHAAQATWVMFLDSDDFLLLSARDAAIEQLAALDAATALVFFRCQDTDGTPLDPRPAEDIWFSLGHLVRYGTGSETLPVLRTEVFQKFSYEASLRGFESIAYIRIARAFGRALLSPHILRVYDTGPEDRISTAAALLGRRCLLARGYAILLQENLLHVSPAASLVVSAQLIKSGGLCLYWRLMGRPSPRAEPKGRA